MKRICPECGEEIFGRSDKKFCSDQCRSTHNNRLGSDKQRYIREINTILRRNRKILAQLNPENKTRVTKEELLQLGFRFNFFTERYTTKKGVDYFFCYEQGYLPLENNYYLLVARSIDTDQEESSCDEEK